MLEPHPRRRGAQLARQRERAGLRLPDPEPAVRGVPARRQPASLSAAASRSATRCSTSPRWPRAGSSTALAARRGASLRPARAERLLRDGPGCLARAAPCAVRAAEVRCARRHRCGCASAWCRRPRSNTRVPARIGDYTDFYTSIDHALNITPALQSRRRRDAQLPLDADRLPRARLDHRRQRPALPAADGPDAWRRAPRAPTFQALRPARLRARTRHLDRPGQCARRADRAGARRAAHLRHLPAQRLVGARHPVLGDGAARPLPGEELRDHDLALDRDDGSAGAVPPGLAARPPTDPQPLAYLESRSQPRRRRDRHPARGLARERAGPRGRRRRRRACRPPASGTSTGAWRRWWRTTRWAAATCNAGDLFGSGTISGPGPGEAGAHDRADARRAAAGGARPTASSALSCTTAMRCCCAAGARSRALRASASARAAARCCRRSVEAPPKATRSSAKRGR